MLNPFVTYTKLSDETLMQRLQKGDNKALEVVYQRYYTKLLYFSIKMLNNNRETASDITQDVFLKLIETPEKFNTSKNFKSWIYAVTANQCRKIHRLIPTQNIEEKNLELTDQKIEIERDLSLFMKDLDRQLENVSDRHKEAFILKYNENFTLLEIAQVQDCPVGTVKSRLHYTLQFLSQQLTIHKNTLNTSGYERI